MASKSLAKGDWVRFKNSGELGMIEECLDGGERLWIRIPSTTGCPFPRWIHTFPEKIKRSHPPDFTKPEINTDEAPF